MVVMDLTHCLIAAASELYGKPSAVPELGYRDEFEMASIWSHMLLVSRIEIYFHKQGIAGVVHGLLFVMDERA